MKIISSKAILWLLGLALGTGVGVHLIYQVDWSALVVLSVWDILILCVSTIVMMILHAFGAAALLTGLGHRARIAHVLAAMLASSIVSFAGDPKLGVPARLAFYKILAHIPLSLGAAATTLESLVWLLLMGVIVGFPSPHATVQTTLLSGLAIGGVFIVIVGILVGPNLSERILLPRKLELLLSPIRTFLFEVRKAVFKIRLQYLIFSVIWMATTYIVDVWSLWYLAKVLGASSASLISIAHSVVVSHLAGVASFIPLGLGVRDATFSILLERSGIDSEIAAAMTLIHRIIRTVLPLALGVLIYPMISTRMRKNMSLTQDAKAPVVNE